MFLCCIFFIGVATSFSSACVGLSMQEVKIRSGITRCCSTCFVLVMQVFLAKRKHDGKYYAVKVLQKKVILNRKEVISLSDITPTMSIIQACIYEF